jgi:class 3 adenylate cyclase/tetratricopeptide (TPR) repeat protein
MQCPRCLHKNESGAKFCEECAAPLARACAKCGRPLSPTAKFCTACAHPTALEGERKQVTILFADLKGSMELLADRDPEEARQLLDPILELMMEAVHRYEGTVNQVIGDGIMALFGAPVAHEDHAVRACYAALHMQESVKRYAAEVLSVAGMLVAIRVGVNSGEVVMRSIGSDLHLDYTAIGKTTHLAARMEQAAPPGSILIAPETLRLVEGYVRVKPIGPIQVKGLVDLVDAYQVTGPTSRQTRFHVTVSRGLTRFVDRDAELERLHRALGETIKGRGQVIAVVGEPGVGKSRLVWEIAKSPGSGGWLVLRAGSVSYGTATPYLPVVELLKEVFKIHDSQDWEECQEKVTGSVLRGDDALRSTLSPILALLDVPVRDTEWQALDPLQRRRETVDAVKRLLLRESEVQPLLVVVEDLQWVDSETQACLDALVEGLPGTKLLLLVTYRSGYQHAWDGTPYYSELRLDSLPPEYAYELLQALVGDDIGTSVLKELLIERTEGNPLFLEETIRTLVEMGVLAGDSGAYHLAKPLESFKMPATVQVILSARIDRLPSEEKQLLQSASVIGKDFSQGLLQAITGEAEGNLRRYLSHLQAAGLVYETGALPEGRYTFKHPITHEVAYGALLHERRQRLHARVLGVLEQTDRTSDRTERLVHHAVRGAVWDKAVDYLRETAVKAYERGALQESLNRIRQALELIPRLPAGVETLRRAIDVRLDYHVPFYAAGEIAALLEHHRETVRLALQLDDRSRLGRAYQRLGSLLMLDARYSDAIEHGTHALRVATEGNDRHLHTSATWLLGVAHSQVGNYRAAVSFFMPMVNDADVDTTQSVQYGMSAPARIQGSARLAGCFSLLGDFEQALGYSNRAIQAVDVSEHSHGRMIALYFRGISLAYRGDFAPALEDLRQAVSLCESKGFRTWLPTAYTALGWITAWLGHPAEGIRHLAHAPELQESMGIKFSIPWSYALLGEGLLLSGSVSDARAAADKALNLALVNGERGHEAKALQVIGEISRVSAGQSAALNYYDRARRLASELGMRPLATHCHLGLGKLYRTTDLIKAAEHLSTAITMYREMGMRFWLEKADEEIAGLGITSTVMRSSTETPMSCTVERDRAG